MLHLKVQFHLKSCRRKRNNSADGDLEVLGTDNPESTLFFLIVDLF